MSSCPIEEVAAAVNGPMWFQMYIWRDRGLLSVLVLTVDVPCAGARDRDCRNGFSIPLRALAGGAAHPRWSYLIAWRPLIRLGNLPDGGGIDAAALSAQTNRHFDPAATWEDLAWLRDC